MALHYWRRALNLMLRLSVIRDVFFGGGRALGVDRFSGHGTKGPIFLGWTPYIHCLDWTKQTRTPKSFFHYPTNGLKYLLMIYSCSLDTIHFHFLLERNGVSALHLSCCDSQNEEILLVNEKPCRWYPFLVKMAGDLFW
jgi:hypothetical protein